ncbi:PilW family protein [Acetobacterium woodii]|uniref:Prepilin-type N-terminal cleavage/methylation domain-containing protein n=1 Tax=Acetobacterium woodii (strain ATCC 29683 / DSM 1030 / JCM 2381 / KCTC 1655 / WB1) TaxID=931626 RepID=H6LFS2_ACEWD|nr:prepilin-type N-terminal cleavage/methylation domain-containing protein [Acetobacterium woodii]AFA47017.1 hypothetical protein containing prepillin-like cleavage and methylation domain [Acetobacterium woodii DSM 1030]
MKSKSRCDGNKGFTLVELLVALMVSGIMIAMMASVFLMSQKIYTRGGDISFKQKSITNVETDLQNALSKAKSVVILGEPDINADFNIGFNASGLCTEEYYNKTTKTFDSYQIDQISEITLEAMQNGNVYSMNYKLFPKVEKSSMSTLSGAIIMNNIKNPGVFASPVILDKSAVNYLVIEFETGS